MKQLVCKSCGANDLVEKNGYRICRYCNAKYLIQPEDVLLKGSNIALNDDIKALLKKCEDDPANARRYANLVLDMDPSNSEAKKYFLRK